ncbi:MULTISPECIES: VOC family protein [Tenacibaculum]|uniref:VOC family protein n=1 Tax=Tenacibaculum mesophilum TaxID=104268 RepID=A0AAE9MM29_9FLAO|nr:MULTISPECIES: VOC family protein [Tenacibaculum]GFD75093.1 VOC family protein [Tenacibaculum sp. KUL113]GFD82110.1 VOC family protein [Tenacibaculum sp. KUL118]GFD92942.1 VOC family protein [Alteromonas sp. KUL154]GFD99163.1 VOC family protein [Alteromonas sp. KUL156]MCG7502445.1 VOC family protein [Tenacibaculum sp. Mcav3-52]
MQASTYLHFNGNCKEAMTFYADVLGGEMTMLMQFKDAPEEVCKNIPEEAMELTMHCTVEAGGFSIMGSDFLNEKEAFTKGNNFAVSINTEDEDEAVAIFNGLSSDGAFVMMPFEEAFWGGKFGMLKDKYGVNWMVSLEEQIA